MTTPSNLARAETRVLLDFADALREYLDLEPLQRHHEAPKGYVPVEVREIGRFYAAPHPWPEEIS